VAVAILAFPGTLLGQKKKKADATDPPVDQIIQVDPVGQPVNYVKPEKGQGPRLFVWWADGAWHVRSKTPKKKRTFDGNIHVVGGKVIKIFNFQGMETAKNRDVGLLNTARTTISFRFTTKGAEDGFDFVVSPTAKSVQFEVRLDGYPHPEAIAVGAKGVRAPQGTFTFPAHPDKEQSDNKGE
jgi:hypothetical protein